MQNAAMQKIQISPRLMQGVDRAPNVVRKTHSTIENTAISRGRY